MDITQTSRAYFAMPSPTPSEKISLAASSTVYTYHCLCTHLLLATSTPLPALPKRKNSQDGAHMMPLPPPPTTSTTTASTTGQLSAAAARVAARRASEVTPSDHYGLLLSTHLDGAPEVVTSSDGFEKRYLQRCGRCALVVGYQLDWQQFGSGERHGRRDDIVYLLPGGFVTTSDMIMGGKAAASAGAGTGTAGGNASSEKAGLGLVSVSEVKV
ncbi:unnamed protein product [Periconia digitata]|uniref:STEEP1 domain-containing protein n=1 Tax=Periconia digitata TaxID=1303443 RepID=A0A9W4UH48_9PLEO|nr:unnamed protein product [Periconia digitata]